MAQRVLSNQKQHECASRWCRANGDAPMVTRPYSFVIGMLPIGAFKICFLFNSPDQLPKSATLPKWVMLFLIRQAQIQNNPIMHCFNWNNLLFVCWFWATYQLKFIMFWTYLDYWIHVTIIMKQNNMFCFLNKNFWKPLNLNFKFLY